MSTAGFRNRSGALDSYGCTFYTGQRGPLFSCGFTSLSDDRSESYCCWWDASKHRPDQIYSKAFGSTPAIVNPGYAENVGYSDGSVRWFFGLGMGTYDPFTR